MLLDKRSHGFLVSLQHLDSPNLVLTHETAVAFDIGTEDGSELAFDTLRCHGITPLEFLGAGED